MVEWYFKCVKELGSFADSKNKLLEREMPVGLVYEAAVLLKNQNCVQPNEISQYFECAPPSLEEYINVRSEDSKEQGMSLGPGYGCHRTQRGLGRSPACSGGGGRNGMQVSQVKNGDTDSGFVVYWVIEGFCVVL